VAAQPVGIDLLQPQLETEAFLWLQSHASRAEGGESCFLRLDILDIVPFGAHPRRRQVYAAGECEQPVRVA
jgi:hypothetical protein